MASVWNAHRMKSEGPATLDGAILAASADVVRGLVIEFLRLNAGQKVLRKKGIAPEAIAIGAVDLILNELFGAHATPAGPPAGPAGQPEDDEDPGFVSDPSGYRGLDTDIELGDIELESDCDDEHAVGTGHPRAKAAKVAKGGKGAGGKGKGSLRPARVDLEEWSRGLSVHSKYGGVSSLRYRGLEFRKVLLRHMLCAGQGTSSSNLRGERHHPTPLNQKASLECNEGGTQATCECHSAGPKSLEGRLETFLSESRAAGLSRVNIVTGLGSHGGGGTVRQTVPLILQASPLVSRFEIASNYSAAYVDIIN